MFLKGWKREVLRSASERLLNGPGVGAKAKARDTSNKVTSNQSEQMK